MIIMLNGAFGVGKTTIAQSLVASLPHSMIFDPEEVGYMLRRITDGVRCGAEDTDDFQDIALWRTLTIETAAALRRRYQRDLIVPMTLANPKYLEQIFVGNFCRIELHLHYFRMPGVSRAHISIGRVLQRAAGIANAG